MYILQVNLPVTRNVPGPVRTLLLNATFPPSPRCLRACPVIVRRHHHLPHPYSHTTNMITENLASRTKTRIEPSLPISQPRGPPRRAPIIQMAKIHRWGDISRQGLPQRQRKRPRRSGASRTLSNSLPLQHPSRINTQAVPSRPR